MITYVLQKITCENLPSEFGGKKRKMASSTSSSSSSDSDDLDEYLALAALFVVKKRRRRRSIPKRLWVRPWLNRREDLGAFNGLMQELGNEDIPGYISFQRLHPDLFEELLMKVSPLIEKRDTNMRMAIPPAVRLALTLRYLATGNTYMSHQFEFRVAANTIGKIVPETCSAIFQVLRQEYFSLLVEFDDVGWQRREWIKVHEIFQIFLVENTLIWALRQEPGKLTRNKVHWPALNFKALVDKVGYNHNKSKPVEFLVDRHVEFLEESDLRIYKEDDPTIISPAKEDLSVRKAVRLWLEYQDGQSILLTTPSVLVGFRVEVYRAEGTTQWYTAVIQSYNDNTKELSVTDDTVLEEHNEDPAQVQMKLIGEGVVESILKGENLGITPRRRSCNSNHHPITPVRYTSNRSVSPSHSTSPPVKGSNTRSKGRQRTQDPTILAPPPPPDKEPKSVEKNNTRPRIQRDRKRKSEDIKISVPSLPNQDGKNIVSLNKRARSADPRSPKTVDNKDTVEKRSAHPDRVCVRSGVLPPDTQPTVVVKPVKHLPSGSTNLSPVKPIKNSPKDKVKTRRSKVAEVISLPQSPSAVSHTETKSGKPCQNKEEDVVKSSPLKEIKATAAGKVKKVKAKASEKDDRSKRAQARAEKGKVKSIKSEERSDSKSSQDVVVLGKSKPSRQTDSKILTSESPKASWTKNLPAVSNKSPQAKNPVSDCSKSSQVKSPASDCLQPPQDRNSESDCSQALQAKVPTLDCCKSQQTKQTVTDKVKDIKPVPVVKSVTNSVSKPSSCEPVSKSSPAPIKSKEDSKPISEPKKSQDTVKVEKNVQPSLPIPSPPKSSKSEGTQTLKSTASSKGKGRPSTEGKLDQKAASPVSSSHLSCSSKSSPKHESEPTMHYRKIRILHAKKDGSSNKSSSGQEPITASSGINVNHSLTDQLAKLASVKEKESLAWNNNDIAASTVCPNSSLAPIDSFAEAGRTDTSVSSGAASTVAPIMHSPSAPQHSCIGLSYYDRDRGDLGRPRDNGYMGMPFTEQERSHSRMSDDRSSSRASLVDDKRPSSTASSTSIPRMDEAKRIIKDGDSPLVFDKSEPVRVYRDPELLKKDELRYFHMQQQRQTPVAPQVSSSYPSVHNPIPQAHPSSLPAHHISARTLLSPANPSLYGAPMSLSSHLGTLQSHLDPSLSGLSSLTHQQALSLPYSQHILQPQQHMLSYARLQTAQLEMLWQQKYPTLPVPPPWMLNQYQDELLRDVNIIRDRELAIDRERREREVLLERERAERERHDRERVERERAEQERREREERDRIERERKEREKVERERLEKERQEKERAEHERLERERRERERKEQELLKHEQERAERERVKENAEAAVNKHFTESLRLASQKKALSGNWPPSICLPKPSPGAPLPADRCGLPPPSGPVPTEPHHSGSHPGSGSHPSAFTHLLKQNPVGQHPSHHYPKQMTDLHKPDDKSRMEEASRLSDSSRLNEEKRAMAMQQEQTLRAQLLKEQEAQQTQQLKESVSMSLGKAFPGHPSGSSGHPGHPGQVGMAEQHAARQGFPKHPQQPQRHNPSAGAPVPRTTAPTTVSGGTGAAGVNVKQEPHFSLYGYQPQHQMYISQDKLYMSLKDEKAPMTAQVKEERPPSRDQTKHVHQSASSPSSITSADKKGQLVTPPPLIKDQMMGKHGSVIVENRPKDAHPTHGSITLGTAMSPRPNPPKDVKPDIKSHAVPATNAGPTGAVASALQAKLGKKPDGQSPLRVASPQQLSAAVMQPLELPRSTASAPGQQPGLPVGQQPGQQLSKPGQPAAGMAGPQVPATTASALRQYMGTIAQPPVSLPHTAYSLIQQGLVPNPIYSPSSSVHTAKLAAEQQQQSMAASPGGVNSAAVNAQKRRIQKDLSPKGKKPKVEPLPQSTAGPTIPVTTQPIATNPQPYTTMPNNHQVTAATTSSAFTSCQPGQSARLTKSTGFMDSFRSFVENTVQNAFLNDQELGAKYKGRHKVVKSTTASNTGTTTSLPVSVSAMPGTTSSPTAPSSTNTTSALPPSLPSTVPSSSSLPTSSSHASILQSLPFQSQQPPGLPFQLTGVVRPGPSNTPGGASVGSNSSIMDTINRVANGCLESDSDTLSAPSPPPHIKSGEMRGASPIGKAGMHAKCKKAWLMRYSDEDKDKGPFMERASDPNNSGTESKAETLKDCYVNCSYISPTKEGGNKSPISMLKEIPLKDEDTTTSASEAESQGGDGSQKRRMKPKRRRGSTGSNTSKKARVSDVEERSLPNSTGKKRFSKQVREGGKDCKSNASSEGEEEEVVVRRPVPVIGEPLKPAVSPKVKDLKPDIVNRPSPLTIDTTPDDKPDDKPEEKQEDKSEDKPEVKQESKPEVKTEKKRGRKPKDKDSSVKKTDNPSQVLANKPLNRAPMAKLKKTQEPFLQDGPCVEVAPKLMKCRECKMTPNQRNKKLPNIFCRFYAFRRIRYNAKGALSIAGFSEPSDAESDDIELWMPRLPILDPLFDTDMAKYIIANVGDRFCELVEQEKEAMSWCSPDTIIAWKRAVQGVREMCDVCDTTLFNMHWVCHKCGFVVCIDCYRQRTRKAGGCSDQKCTTCDQDGVHWLTCSVSRNAHEPEKLMLTQIIPSDALWVVGDVIHDVRDKWRIRSNCPCGRSTTSGLLTPKNGVNQLLNAVSQCISPDSDKPLVNGVAEEYMHNKGKKKTSGFPDNSLAIAASMNGAPSSGMSPLSLLADVASMDSENNLDGKKTLSKIQEKLAGNGQFGMTCNEPMSPGSESQDGDKKNCSTLRELLTKTAGKMKTSPENSKKPKTIHSTLDDIIQQVVERNLPKEGETPCPPLQHYIPKNGSAMAGREGPIPQYTLTETSVLYPDLPHSWLDNGRLLRLHEPHHKGNLKIFQQQWRRAQPVLVSNCQNSLNPKLWNPDWFLREFGNQENDLVNCRKGIVLVGHAMKVFWDGFECATKRMSDNEGQHLLLKLKDWPPTEDFCDLLPNHFKNLMSCLPLPEYTQRNGVLNMAARLPDFFVKPDLGPKMYNAYGSARYPKDGSTNLHLDVSDAVNVMVYVGIPEDDDFDHREAVLKAIDEVGCCMMTKRRIRESGENPGALWHIYDPHDADKIRDLLNKVGKERGEEVEPHHDPIHDQSWYLDEELRRRLLDEYNVQGYTIVQCKGDAIFIPAGAPHQVRNLHSCIKCAEDFVSPENLNSCFKMTQEFRHLSNTHSNHEDKLQVKNIIFHTVKDAVAVLQNSSK